MTAPIQPTPIDLLPVGPRPIDTEEQFNAKSFATIEAQEAMIPQLNAAIAAAYQNAVASYEAALAAGASKEQAVAAALNAFNEADRSRNEADRSEAAKQAAMVIAAAIGVEAGLPSMAGKAGQALVVLPDETGAGWAVTNTRGSQDYTASQSIPKSLFGTATFVLVEIWGGGASGGAAAGSTGSQVAQPPGGEGGSYNCRLVRMADLATNTTLTIGAGGLPVSASSIGTPVFTRGNNGGNSTFAGLVAYGGLASDASSGEAAPSNSAGGANGGAGGGLGALTLATGSNNRLTSGPGGPSSLGGGGGGAGHIDAGMRVPGAASNAGSGGAGLQATATGQTAASGVVPSGGGGGIRLLASGNVTVTSGAGARGQARLTWW